MKNITLNLVLILILYSCNSPSENIDIEKSNVELDYDIADMYLEYDAEKIGLIAVIKNIPHEKVNSILRDYLAKTFGSTELAMKSPDFVVKVIDTIAKSNDLSIKATASIIFSYQYEMITRDEIMEESMKWKNMNQKEQNMNQKDISIYQTSWIKTLYNNVSKIG